MEGCGQIVHSGLECPLVRHPDIHVVIEIFLRQQGLRRARPRDAVDGPGGVAHIVALGDAHQGKFGGEVIGLGHDPMAQSLGEGEGYGVPQSTGEAQIAQYIFG